MNKTSRLKKARNEFLGAQKQATMDEKAAKLARKVALATKLRLRQARKMAKLAKKSVRKAEDKADKSLERLERAQAELDHLEKQSKKRKRAGKGKESGRPTPAPKPKANPGVAPNKKNRLPPPSRTTPSSQATGSEAGSLTASIPES